MAEQPSPLALAREAEETAHKAWVRKGMQPALDEYTAWRAAHRAHREALVEAALRWRKRNPGYRHVGQCIYNDSGDVLTMADVLTAIEDDR